MPKNNKGKIFYEITREKPVGKLYVLLMGGSVGAVISFFIVSVLGSLNGVEMDDLVFFFILSSVVGFFIGGLLTWLFVIYFSKIASGSSPLNSKVVEPVAVEPQADQPIRLNSEPIVATEDEGKGQSVDFVFPELSPDK